MGATSAGRAGGEEEPTAHLHGPGSEAGAQADESRSKLLHPPVERAFSYTDRREGRVIAAETAPVILPIRTRHCARRGERVLHQGHWEDGVMVVPPMAEPYLIRTLNVTPGTRLGDLGIFFGAVVIPIVSRVITAGARLVLSGLQEGSSAAALFAERYSDAEAASAAAPQDDAIAEDVEAPFHGAEAAQRFVPWLPAQPHDEGNQSPFIHLDHRGDGLSIQAGLLLGVDDRGSPLVVLPEAFQFLKRCSNFRWHDAAPPMSALCLPPVDGNRPEALLFYLVPWASARPFDGAPRTS